MEKIKISNVTLLGIDCVNVERLIDAMNVSQENIEFGAVKLLTSLETSDSRKIEIPKISSIEDYSIFCIKELHKDVETDFVLLIQYDGFIINPDSWTDEFLKYDYIGAPWLVADWLIDRFEVPANLKGQMIVGNGGFCIRSKKFLEVSNKLYKLGKIPKAQPEDIAMCVWHKDEFENEEIKFAPAEIANKFSTEYESIYKYDKQFGFHGFRYDKVNDFLRSNVKYSFVNKYLK